MRDLDTAAEDGNLSSVRAALVGLATILVRSGIELSRLTQYREVLVISPQPVPIDVLPVSDEPLGRRVIFEHLIAANADDLRSELPNYLRDDRESLKRAAVLAIVPMPSGIPRQDQDIIKAASKLNAMVPVDIVLQPSARQSIEYFSRTDIGILHLDTHGSPMAVQLGTNEERFFRVSDFPSRIRPPLVLLVGCSTGAGAESLAPGLVRLGAKAVIGMAFVFRSGDPSGGDIKNPLFYDTLWSGIVAGKPIGEALLRAKQAMPNNEWSAMWLLFGNANLSFKIKQKS